MQRFTELSEDERTERLLRVAGKGLLAYGLVGDLRLVAGDADAVFRLRAGGHSYAVRVSAAGRDHASLLRELVWLAALGRDTRLAIPEPVLTLTGDLFRSVSMEGVPGTRACAVQRWVEGERREAEPREDEAAAAGRLVGALHAHAETFRWPDELQMALVPPADRLLHAADALTTALDAADDRARLCDVVAAVADRTSAAGNGPEEAGPVHGDLRLRRLRHAAGEAGVLGFGNCRTGSFADDLSVLWSDLGGREATPALRTALLDGYASVRRAPRATPDEFEAFASLRCLEGAARLVVDARTRRGVPAEVVEHVGREIRRAADALPL